MLTDVYRDTLDDYDAVCPLMDIKIAQPALVYKLSKKLVKLEAKRQKLLIKLKKEWNSDLIPSPEMQLGVILNEFIKISNYDPSLVEDPTIIGNAKTCAKIVHQLIRIHSEIACHEKKINSIKSKKREISSAFVTFQYRNDKKLFNHLFPRSQTQGFFGCYKRYKLAETTTEEEELLIKKGSKMIKTSDIIAVDPVDPLNVNWEHLDRSRASKCKRRFCSWALYLIFYSFRKGFWLRFYT